MTSSATILVPSFEDPTLSPPPALPLPLPSSCSPLRFTCATDTTIGGTPIVVDLVGMVGESKALGVPGLSLLGHEAQAASAAMVQAEELDKAKEKAENRAKDAKEWAEAQKKKDKKKKEEKEKKEKKKKEEKEQAAAAAAANPGLLRRWWRWSSGFSAAAVPPPPPPILPRCRWPPPQPPIQAVKDLKKKKKKNKKKVAFFFWGVG
ncbi:hypothetical protein PG985_013126 [Apiospora marii]|uniref:uncharacterized protein n=1 Tax=Apiospora marii TaxID=335849 RepID=UPI00312F6D6F